MYYKDGDGPPVDVVQRWLALADAVFARKDKNKDKEKTQAIAVHCVAGLGRYVCVFAGVLQGLSSLL